MTSIKHSLILISTAFILSLFFVLPANAERMGIPGYDSFAIDFPEGFEVTQVSTDKKSFQLENKELSINCIIKVMNKGSYGTCQRALDDTIGKLKLSGTSKAIEWRNLYAATASVSGKLFESEVQGLAECVTLPYEKGYISVIGWSKKSDYSKCQDAIESLMDSVSIDQGSLLETGLYTTSKYSSSPKTEKKITLEIDGKKISTQIYLQDIAQSQYVVEREYKVLCMYQKSQKWQEAWQRYYRMIFKDSYSRLERAAFDIENALEPDCTDETDLAQKLLYWTQNFTYEREKTGSDFTCLPGILAGQGNDCDGRSLLLAVLLTHMKQDAVIFVSSKHSHAMAGFVSTHPGRSFSFNGKKYLMGETTKQGLTWGIVAQNMSSEADWICVSFPQ